MCWTHRKLGNVLKDRGALEEAERELRAEIALRERILAANPQSSRARSALAGAAHDLAMVLERQERTAEAIAQYERSIEEEARALEAQPANPRFRQHMAFHLINLERAYDDCGRREGNLARLRRALEMQDADPGLLFYLAQRFGYYAAAAPDEQAPALADEAMAVLRRAVERGFRDAAKIRAAGNLAVLRERADYRALVDALEEESPPGERPPR
jgi:tetratricopeptide (TPR) repeat protein